jgi:hypothetical protein
MTMSEPEAESEYSRGPVARKGRKGPFSGASAATRTTAGGALLAALLLLVAEFLPLFQVGTSAPDGVVSTVRAGSHHSYALLPIAVLVAGLALAWSRSPARLPLLAMGVLGAVALVIALARDLPDAHSHGIERSHGTFVTAAAHPRSGLYLETAGAIVLLIASAGGLLLQPRSAGGVQAVSSRRRSAS